MHLDLILPLFSGPLTTTQGIGTRGWSLEVLNPLSERTPFDPDANVLVLPARHDDLRAAEIRVGEPNHNRAIASLLLITTVQSG